jgi:hypothetical protein
VSCNRENVTWQSEDGTWSIGFYAYHSTGDPMSEDWDDEWDVEYEDDFHWVSTGHSDEDSAYQSWHGANPGGTIIVPFSPETAEECRRMDSMARLTKKELFR